MFRAIHYYLCLVLALQGTFAVVVQHDRLANVQASTTGDVELICTGAEMKWISLPLTEELGQFVFVEAPEEFADLPLDNLCPEGALADAQSAYGLVSQAVLVQFHRYQGYAASLLQRPYTLFPYQKAQSRAPPVV